MVINNTDKNVGGAFADSLTSEESRQQFYDKVVYLFLYEGQAKMLVKNTTMPILKRGTCSQRKSQFYLVEVEHFQKFLILCHLKPSNRQDRLQLGTTGYKLHLRYSWGII